MISRAHQMATSSVGDVVSVSSPPYFYLLLVPRGRTQCEPPWNLCCNPKSLLYSFAPALLWSFPALLRRVQPSRTKLINQVPSIHSPATVSSSLVTPPPTPTYFNYSFVFLIFLALSPPPVENKFLEGKNFCGTFSPHTKNLFL